MLSKKQVTHKSMNPKEFAISKKGLNRDISLGNLKTHKPLAIMAGPGTGGQRY